MVSSGRLARAARAPARAAPRPAPRASSSASTRVSATPGEASGFQATWAPCTIQRWSHCVARASSLSSTMARASARYGQACRGQPGAAWARPRLSRARTSMPSATAKPAPTPATSGPSQRLMPCSTPTNSRPKPPSSSQARAPRSSARCRDRAPSTRNTGALVSEDTAASAAASTWASEAPITVARPSVPQGMMAMPASAMRSAARRSKRLSSSGTVAISDTPKPVIASSSGAKPSTMNTT